jgi:hypothetical protein
LGDDGGGAPWGTTAAALRGEWRRRFVEMGAEVEVRAEGIEATGSCIGRVLLSRARPAELSGQQVACGRGDGRW